MDSRRRGPAEAPNLGEPAAPRPSASVALLRRGGKHGDRALEVLLLKRTEEARFMVGCPHGAKNTLVKNYLWLAEHRGVEVQAERTVTDIQIGRAHV